jgi:DNA helicase-2/ATP-dependent DNA helicase PcrA
MAVSQAMGYSVQDPSDEGFGLGQRVVHPKFGHGTVIDSEGSGERTRVHVHFDACGSKWLALAYAKLEAA